MLKVALENQAKEKEISTNNFSVYVLGSTSLDRQNLLKSLKPAVDRQQRKFFKKVSRLINIKVLSDKRKMHRLKSCKKS